MLAVVRAYRSAEKCLHCKFLRHWIRGEWFRPVAEILRLAARIASLCKKYQL